MENKYYYFTFIIGYRHQQDRLYNLRRTIDWVNAFSNSQLILVEQDTHSKISHLSLNCNHIFVKSDLPYNRSWAFNIGLSYAKSNIIVFGDSDIIMDPNDFLNAIKEIKNYDMISPYNSVVDLEQHENNISLRDIININRKGRGEEDNQKINICGGISMFKKDAINKIGGWSEDFIGWGGEDDFQTLKVKKFLSWKELEARCYHLYHKKNPPSNNFYQRSLSLLKQASEMSDEKLTRLINNSRRKIGMINKYHY